MKRSLTILIILAMAFSAVVVEPKKASAITAIVEPAAVNEVAQFTLTWTCPTSPHLDTTSLILTFTGGYDLTDAKIDTSTCIFSGGFPTSISKTATTITFNFSPAVRLYNSYPYTITLYKDAKIKNPTGCDNTLQTHISVTTNPTSTTVDYQFRLESKIYWPSTDSVLVDPPLVNTYSQTSNTSYTFTFQLGQCGALAAGDSIFLDFPTEINLYSMTTIDRNCVDISFTNSRPYGQANTGTFSTPPIHPESITREQTALNRLKLVLPTGTTIPVRAYVSIVINNTCGFQSASTAKYYTFSASTSKDTFAAASPNIMIGNHCKVTVLGNTTNAQNPEYKLEWTLHQGATLSGDNGDWIEVDFRYPPNTASITNDFTVLVPQASSIMLTNTAGWYWGGSTFYASSVQAMSATRLRIFLPAGFSVLSGGSLTITFLSSAGFTNTNTAGTYRLRIRHRNATEWIPSDPYSILDGVNYNYAPSVDVYPPTVSQDAMYTIMFTSGSNIPAGGTITIAFPNGTTLKNWNNTIGAGSIYLMTGRNNVFINNVPPIPSDVGADNIFDPNIDCPPVLNPNIMFQPPPPPLPPPPTAPTVNGPVPLTLNASVSNVSGSGLVVTITLPNGFNIGANNWVAIRFCKSAGIVNPSQSGPYTLQIKTSGQPAYAISTPYLITTNPHTITVTPNPNGTCAQNVEYKVTFTPGMAGELRGDAGDFIDVSFNNATNPAPDFASIQNNFQPSPPNPAVTVTDTSVYVSPPFTGSAARWDISFRTGIPLAVTDTITLTFPPNVSVPATFAGSMVYVSNPNAPFPVFDTNPPGGTAVTPTVNGQIVTIPVPVAFAAGERVYIRFQTNCGLISPTAPNSSYVLNINTSQQTFKVPSYFGITNDYAMNPSDPTPSLDPQWQGGLTSIVPTVFPSTAGMPAQYDLWFSTHDAPCDSTITATSDLVLEFPPGTIIPSTIPPNTIHVAGTPAGFAFDQQAGLLGNAVTTITTNPTARTITLTNFTGGSFAADLFLRIHSTAGIINPSNPSAFNQVRMTLTDSGCVATDGVSVLSEFYTITPPRIGGVNIPSQSVYILGGFYYSGFQNNWVTRIDILPGWGNLKTMRIWIPAGMQLQQGQPVSIVFTSAAGLVNTCTAGSYVIDLRTSKEMAWIMSTPYPIVDAVQFVCGNYPRAMPPTVSQTAQYDISFTTGPQGGLRADIDTITIAFPSMTLFTSGGGYGSGSIPAGAIYVSTMPMVGDGCPPPAPAVACKFNGTVNMQAVTITTPVPIGNGQTVYIRFCQSAGITNPSMAGAYTLQVKTSVQNTYAISCQYAIGTAISNVEVLPIPDSACNENVEYQVKFTVGQSGGLTGDVLDYVEIDFNDPANPNGASISNNFLVNPPSASSIMFYPGYASWGGYGGKPASQVTVLGNRRLRVFLPAGFTVGNGSQVMMVFTSGARLFNTCTPGSYKAFVSTSKELVQVGSKPYSIQDAVRFISGIPVEVVPPVVNTEAQYTITFDVSATGGLNANSGTISIAFPTGTTVPYQMSPGTIWVANGQFNAGTSCPPTAPVGVNFAQVAIPPTVSGQVVTFITPINIPNSGRVTVRFCRPAAIKNPYTAGAYTLQVKTSSQPAYATSYPYAIKTAISNVKVSPNPNTICSDDVEYKIEFQNSASSTLSGDLGDYIEVQFDDPRNLAPDFASIQNNFSATTSVTNVHIEPLANPIAGAMSKWDISFNTGFSTLILGSFVYIDFPTTTSLAGITPANVFLSTSNWAQYPSNNSIGAIIGVNPSAVLVTGARLRLTMPAGFNAVANTTVYIRIGLSITNPTTPGFHTLQVSTNSLTNPATSNYFGLTSTIIPAIGCVNTQSTVVGPVKCYPQSAGSISQIDIAMILVNSLVALPPPNPRTITLTFPNGFQVPSFINPADVYVSSSIFLNAHENSNPPIPTTTFIPLTVAPLITGNTVRLTLPAAFVPPAGSYVEIQFRPGAGIKNPVTPRTTYQIENITLTGNNGPYGNPTNSEYFSITPSTSPIGSTSVQTDHILFGSAYYSIGNQKPSRIEAIGSKTLRIYLPLGYTISASTTTAFTFLPAAHLRNTCTPGNYILKLRTSKDQDFIDSLPYPIIAAVRNIDVRAVPPIISTNANYTIVFTDTSASGLKKDRDTVTISFPQGTVVPPTMTPGSIYVARTADFTNEVCPPTHPGVYGTQWAPLTAPPVNSGNTVTLTVPIDINAGELIAIRFCASAGLVNPPNAQYYTLQVMTSAQPQYAVSKPYPIISGLNRPKVTVVPNIISRGTDCQLSKHTITFKTGTAGTLAKGTGRIYIAMQLANTRALRGYFTPPSEISANCIRINGTLSTANAPVTRNPLASTGFRPKPEPTFAANMFVIELITPIDIQGGADVTIELDECANLCNPYQEGNYTIAVWTNVENAAIESEVYSITDSLQIISVDVQPPTVSEFAEYTIRFTTFANLVADQSTITVTFPEDTSIPTSMLPGHITVSIDGTFNNNAGERIALGPVTISGRSITFVCPFDRTASNDVWIRFGLGAKIKNPSTEGPYTLRLRTSVQPNDAESPPYYIVTVVAGAIVTVTPPTNLFPNAQYQIDFNLSGSSILTKDISSITIEFPNNDIFGAGGGYTGTSVLPTAISAMNVSINNVRCTINPNISVPNRRITIIVPVDIPEKASVKVVLSPPAGMTNPVTGTYRIRLQTSSDPIWIQSKNYQIYSTIGGFLGGRNPVVAVSYLVATTTANRVIGNTNFAVDQTLGWQVGMFAAIGDLVSWWDTQIVRITAVGANTLTFTPVLTNNVPAGTQIFSLRSIQRTQLNGIHNNGVTSITVDDATPFVGQRYLVIDQGLAAEELCIIGNVNTNTNVITLDRPTQLNHANNAFVFGFVNNIGIVNEESYYNIAFVTGATGNLIANSSTITITFPSNTSVPDTLVPSSVTISTDNMIYTTCSTVTTNKTERSITITTPIDIGAGAPVYVAFSAQSGLRNPTYPGAFRLKVRTSSESVDVDSLNYFMEGNGAPTVDVNPCIKGEVGAKYTITFTVTQSLPAGSLIFVTFPPDTVLPSVLRQENILVNGMPVVVQPVVTPATLQVQITAPKILPASQPIVVTFLPESRIKNPTSIGSYRLQVRTNVAPNNVNVSSVDYYICPKQTPDAITIIPGCPIVFTPAQSRGIQAQLKDITGQDISYGVDYNWSTTIGTISGISSGSMTLTAPNSSGSGTVTVEATYQGVKKTQTCTITVTAPLGSVAVTPAGPLSLNFGATQVFGGQAVDADGKNITSGVNYKWGVTGGIGAITPSSGQQTTFSAGQTATSGSLTCEASYGGVTKSYSVNLTVVSSGGSGGGSGGGGSGGGGGGGGTTPATLIKATVDPTTAVAGVQLGGVTFTLTALDDLSGGQIRIDFPITWANPTVEKIQFPPAEGVVIGNVIYSANTMTIPISTMTAGKVLTFVWLNPPAPPAPNNYLFTVIAKKAGTAEPSPANPHPVITVSQGTGPASADGTGLCVVTPDIVSAGSTGVKLTFVFTAQMDITDGRLQVTIPRDWTQPTQTEGGKGLIRVVNSEGDVPTVQVLQNGLVEFMFMKFLKNHKLTFEYTNVDVPGDEKTETFTVKTSSKTGIPKPIPNQPQVRIQRSGMSGLSVTPKPTSAGSPASYEIRFKTSSAGTLTKGTGTIYLQFPVDTLVPTTVSPTMIKVQSVEALAVEANQSTRSLLITVGTDIPSNSTVVIQISDQAGLKNPTNPGNEYKLTAKTSSDGSLVQSASYTIDASKVTQAKVTPDPVITAAEAQYTITFNTGAGGRLYKAQDKIILEFRNDTYIPPRILPTMVTINGKALTDLPQIDTVALKIILTVPDAIGENSEVKIVFSKDAGLKNPTKSGSYTLYTSTTKETIRVESDTYMIGQSQISAPKVTLSSNTAGEKCVDYTIEFTTGQFGSLTPASTITIWFHPAYSLGTFSAQRILINGQSANGTPSTKSNQGWYLTFSPPSSIGPNSNVKIVLKCVDNPTSSATYYLQVASSAEPTYIKSNDYKIGEVLSTLVVINPNSPTGDFGWYRDKPSITLTNNQPSATLWYSIDGGAKQRYTGAPVVMEYGQHTFEYWATDPNFPDEPKQTLGTIKVDNVKPKFTITEPKDGATVTTGQVKVKGTYEEDFMFEVAYNDFKNPSAPLLKVPVIDKSTKTFEFTYQLVKGSNSINIVAKDEAGNTSFEPPLTINYNPVTAPQLLITSPADNTEPTGEVRLVPETVKGQYYLEATTDIVGSIDGDMVKLEVSTDTAPTEWIPLTLDQTMKKVTGKPALKVKAGKNVLTFRATDSNGKTFTWTKVMTVKVSLRFDGVKPFNTVTGKPPVGLPDRSTFNDKPFTATDSAYPFVTQEGRTVVPFRLLGNAFGAKVSYDTNTRTATYEFEGKKVAITQGSNKATVTVNGQPPKQVQIDPTNAKVVPINVGGRLYVPLRFVSENLGWNISYITATRTVQVCYPDVCKP